MSNDDELDVNGQKASRACLMYRAQCFVVAIAARLGPTSTWHMHRAEVCSQRGGRGSISAFRRVKSRRTFALFGLCVLLMTNEFQAAQTT